jgi:hypothetical protein
MLNNQYDGSSSAPPAAHTPAILTKSPRLDKDDVAFILALESGKRYFRLGDYIADRKIPDLWGRLLDEPSILDALRPRGDKVVADLRAKAEEKKLSSDDRALAAHYYRDIPAAVAASDLEFLGGLAESAPAAASPQSQPPVSTAKS